MTPKTELSPEIVARLRDAHERQGNARKLLASLERWHEKLAAENAAVSATEVGEAWRDCYGRARVCLSFTRGELDELLDGDLGKADVSRSCYYIVGNVLGDYIDALEAAIDRRSTVE